MCFDIINIIFKKLNRILILFFLIFFGCKPIEPIEFVEIKNVKVNSLKDNKLKISAEIILNNPNKVKIVISKVDVGIYAENVLLVKIDEENERELSNMTESTIDIQGDINVKNLESFINQKGLALLLGNEKVSLKFKGEIEAKAYGIRDIILIDYAIGNIQDLVK